VGDGIAGLERFYGLFPDPRMAAYIFNLAEDYRIEARLRDNYPVLGNQIVEINRHLLSLREPASSIANPKHAFMETLTVILFGGRIAGQVPANIAAALKGSLMAVKDLRLTKSNVYNTAAAASEIFFIIEANFEEPYEAMKPPTNHVNQELVEKNLGNFGRASRKLDERTGGGPVNRKGPGTGSVGTGGTARGACEGASTEELLRKLYKKKKIKPSEVEKELEKFKTGEEARKYLKYLKSLVREDGELENTEGSYLYPEWGSDILDYRPKWTRVIETAMPQRGGTQFYDDSIKENHGIIKKVRKEFQMLRPVGLEKFSRQLYGDDVDVNSAVEYFVDKKTKMSPSEKNYTRNERKKREISVALLLDMSGSTAGKIIDCEKNAIVVLSEALRKLGDSFAVYGFESEGRENCRFHVVKEFGRAFDDKTKIKVGNINAGCGTLTGAAIRHAAAKLKRQPERVKIIILLSDGEPNDTTACPFEDTRMALREAAKLGIKSFCITVDPKATAYLPKMYGRSSWTVIKDITTLPDKITKIYRRLTT